MPASPTTWTTARVPNTPYGKNPLVRQAFDAAIDRAALVNVVFNDMYRAERAAGVAEFAVL